MPIEFQPDYRNMLDVLANRRPRRLPIYEHVINPPFIDAALGQPISPLARGGRRDLEEYIQRFCGFWRDMTYDTVSYEVCITEILPGGGSLQSEKPGPVQTRADFERCPWAELPALYWRAAEPRFEALRGNVPSGMKPLGGVGNGVFEIAQDVTGYRELSYLQADDPELFADLFARIGDVMLEIWSRFLQRFGEDFAVCRIGDDLGFKTTTMMSPRVIRQHIIPQYRRLFAAMHAAGKPVLFHSCGRIFDVMEDLIAAGMDAKHSNEDVIAPFDEWIARYSGRIGLLGGIDMHKLCTLQADEVYALTLEQGRRWRRLARGWALSSGNSIPEYVPLENYRAMIGAAQAIRAEEE
jgi:uroporphyrinogen decarboxylase